MPGASLQVGGITNLKNVLRWPTKNNSVAGALA